jgi:hypothetical protein
MKAEEALLPAEPRRLINHGRFALPIYGLRVGGDERDRLKGLELT